LSIKQLKIIFFSLIFMGIFLYLDSLSDQAPEKKVMIGSKRFTESYILGEILKQIAEEVKEAPVDYRPGLGNTGILFAALKTGLIDIYPEYTGTIAYEILKRPDLSSVKPELLNESLKHLQLGVSSSLGFHNNYALAMLEERAQELAIKNLSDLTSHPELIFGFSPEFMGRGDGWAGLKHSSYAFSQKKVETIDHSLSYEALVQRKIDVIDIYSTDPKIEKYGLITLIDDRHFFPSYEGVFLYRLEAEKNFPKTWEGFQKLYHQISTQKMTLHNAQAELEGMSFNAIAKHFLNKTIGKTSHSMSNLWDSLWTPDLWTLTKQHLFLSFGALIPAIFVGLLLGITAKSYPLTTHLILNSVGAIQTIPSLALFAFLIPIFKEIGTIPTLVALSLYSLLPIVRNTYTGLTTIPGSQQDAALALGLPSFHRLIKIEIPLASQMILAGIKTAAVLNVGMATIAALIGAGGYGERIVMGLALNNYDLLLAGAIPACFLAICVQFSFDLLDYCLIPRGLRY
jgi:osmoprotectant transport system permease protein